MTETPAATDTSNRHRFGDGVAAPRRRGRARSVGVSVVGVLMLIGVSACGPGSSRTTSPDAEANSPGPTKLHSGSHAASLEVDGTKRTYRTYVPPKLDRSHPSPLVVMLHGGFGSGQQAEKDYGWDAQADAGGFVVAYPDAQNRAWNAGTCCGKSASKGVDDVGFVTTLVEQISKEAAIDPRRVYVAGMSNGAMLAERLACETTMFAAAASVAGAQMVGCDDPHPISMLHIHGSSDDHVPMDGSAGHGIGRVPAHPPVATAIAGWRSVDHCGQPVTSTHGAVTTAAAACADGRAVTLTTVEGAGHQWPGAHVTRTRLHKVLGMDPPSDALNATSTIWAFFGKHPAPG